MLTNTQSLTITRPQVINAFVHLRQEWEQAVGIASLIDVRGSVGLLLFDLVTAIGFTPEEQRQALGAGLFSTFQDAQEAPMGDNQ